VRAGEQVATITDVTGAAGVADLLFTAGAAVRNLNVTVGATSAAPPAIVAPPVGLAVAPAPSVGRLIAAMGAQQTFGVRLLAQPAARDVPVVAASTNPQVANPVSASDVLAGQQVSQITIATGTAGTATITLRAGTEVRELTIVVGGTGAGQMPAVVAAPVGVAIQPAPLAGVVISPVGGVAVVGLRLLIAPRASDIVAEVTTSNASVATVQGSVLIHAGEQVVQVSIVTANQGVAEVTVKAGTETVRFAVIAGTPPPGAVPIIVAPIVGVKIQQ
jgi:hypothetical protein